MQDFTIPSRTSVTAISTFTPPFAEVSVPLKFQVLRYMCSDCGLKTEDVNMMLEHQVNQAALHTRFQRIRRELDIIGVWPLQLMPRRETRQ